MVAVPGGSKGCGTCRKRRVKCDEEKPECRRCTKGGYVCQGYERSLKIRFASIPDSNNSAPRRQPRKAARRDVDAGEGPSSQGQVITTFKFNSPPPEMSFVGFRDEMCRSYLFSNFVWRSYSTPWLDMSIQGELGALPQFTSKALAWSHFGESHNHYDTKMKGGNMHGRVLSSVAISLSNTSHPGYAVVIVPMLMILIHSGDMLTAPQTTVRERRNTRAHIKGIEQVLNVCGPTRFQHPPLRYAFESCRASIIAAALVDGRRCFLEQESWRLLPWALDTASQKSQSRLADILVFVPGFIQDETSISGRSSPQMHEDLVLRIRAQLEALFTWRWLWQQANPTAAWEVEHEGPEEERPVRPELEFRDLEQCIEILTYDITLIWLLGLLWKLEPNSTSITVRQIAARTAEDTESEFNFSPVSKKPAVEEPIGLPGSHRDVRQVAIEIVRAFDFQLRNIRNRAVSSLFFLMPIGLAWTVLCDDPEWSKTIRNILARNEITKGYRADRNMFGFGPYARKKGAA